MARALSWERALHQGANPAARLRAARALRRHLKRHPWLWGTARVQHQMAPHWHKRFTQMAPAKGPQRKLALVLGQLLFDVAPLPSRLVTSGPWLGWNARLEQVINTHTSAPQVRAWLVAALVSSCAGSRKLRPKPPVCSVPSCQKEQEWTPMWERQWLLQQHPEQASQRLTLTLSSIQKSRWHRVLHCQVSPSLGPALWKVLELPSSEASFVAALALGRLSLVGVPKPMHQKLRRRLLKGLASLPRRQAALQVLFGLAAKREWRPSKSERRWCWKLLRGEAATTEPTRTFAARWMARLLRRLGPKEQEARQARLKRLLGAKSSEERRAAALALAHMGSLMLPLLRRWWQKKRGRRLAAFVLTKWPKADPDVLKLALRWLGEARRTTTRQLLLESLVPLGWTDTTSTSKALSRISRWAGSARSRGLQLAALKFLSSHHRGSQWLLSALKRQLQHRDWRCRKAAADLLAHNTGPQGLSLMRQALQDRSVRVKAAAALSLGRWGAAAKPLVPLLGRRLSGRSWRIRYASAEAMKRLGAHASAARRSLVRALSYANWGVRYSSSYALAQMGSSVLPLLLQVRAKKRRRHTRRNIAIAETIERIKGNKPKAAILLLARLMKSRHSLTRYAAIKAIHTSAKANPKVVGQAWGGVTKGCKDRDWRVRVLALGSLGFIRASKRTRRWLFRGLQDRHPSAREAAARALFGDLSRQATKALGKATKDRDGMVQVAAWRALARSGREWGPSRRWLLTANPKGSPVGSESALLQGVLGWRLAAPSGTKGLVGVSLLGAWLAGKLDPKEALRPSWLVRLFKQPSEAPLLRFLGDLGRLARLSAALGWKPLRPTQEKQLRHWLSPALAHGAVSVRAAALQVMFRWAQVSPAWSQTLARGAAHPWLRASLRWQALHPKHCASSGHQTPAKPHPWTAWRCMMGSPRLLWQVIRAE